MMKYVIYHEGEESIRLAEFDDVQAHINELRADYTADEQYDMDRFPQGYDADYKAGDSFTEYFLDTYEIMLTVPMEMFAR